MEAGRQALLRKIKLRPRKRLNTLFIGEYHSAFRGHGLAFDSVREYQYGDDVRSVDWNVTARMGHLYVKQYIEERELSVAILVDVSASTEFGARRAKRDLIVETALFFLDLAQMNRDRVSVCLFTDHVERFMRPKKGRKFVLKAADEMLKCVPQSRRTNIAEAVGFIQRVLKKRSIVFIISDFLDPDPNWPLKMKLLARRHDVIPVQVSDPLEREVHFFGLVEFVDLETGTSFLTDAVPERGAIPILTEFNPIQVSTDLPIENAILRYFEKRNRTRHMR